MNSKASDVSVRPDCDICGQPYHRHMEICGAGMMCPVSAVSYRPKRAATLSPPLPSLEVERLREALEPFVGVRDQFPETVKVINPRLDGMTPVTVTVTKAQFLAARAALSALPLDGGL